MAIERWKPSTTYTAQEKFLLKRLKRVKKLFAFLRNHRHELFDDKFQDELAAIYRDTGAGSDPVCPAQMAMATILAGYVGASDAEAVELTVVDLRWQLVLERLGATEPAFSQGAFQDFRQRMIQTGMDQRLLEQTVEWARRTKEFDYKKMAAFVRVAMDSSPFQGVGRFEDTLNLLGHAARDVVGHIATLLQCSPEDICRKARIPVLLHSSVKGGLDRDWTTHWATKDAVKELVKQVQSLQRWISRQLEQDLDKEPLKGSLATLNKILEQDIEPDPDGGSRIRKGVAKDRQISVRDPEMRHGRKSKSQTIKGFKRHIAPDLDADVILACAVTGANQSDAVAAVPLKKDIEKQNLKISELQVDRQYLSSPAIAEVEQEGGKVISKPRSVSNGDYFPKRYFGINLRQQTITCPIGQAKPFVLGTTVHFDPKICDRCFLRPLCTPAKMGAGRSVSIAKDESLQQRFLKLASTKAGRDLLRQRVAVEHDLAHLSQRQGNKARYVGVRKNLFDTRRASAIHNLETIHREKDKMAA
jgi:hypothetical protein